MCEDWDGEGETVVRVLIKSDKYDDGLREITVDQIEIISI
jgi:hypothetical protein